LQADATEQVPSRRPLSSLRVKRLRERLVEGRRRVLGQVRVISPWNQT
jgi:hypothetical protein